MKILFCFSVRKKVDLPRDTQTAETVRRLADIENPQEMPYAPYMGANAKYKDSLLSLLYIDGFFGDLTEVMKYADDRMEDALAVRFEGGRYRGGHGNRRQERVSAELARR